MHKTTFDRTYNRLDALGGRAFIARQHTVLRRVEELKTQAPAALANVMLMPEWIARAEALCDTWGGQ